MDESITHTQRVKVREGAVVFFSPHMHKQPYMVSSDHRY